MLKLVPSLYMPYENVAEYYSSFAENKRDTKNLGAHIISVMADSPFSYQCFLEGKTYSDDIKMFFLIDDENASYIIGFGGIKISKDYDIYTDELTEGNIRFGVREIERSKGYGSTIFSLILEECQKAGISTICATCFKENDHAEAILRKCGGKFSGYCQSDHFERMLGVPKYIFNLTPTLPLKNLSLTLETKEDTN